MKSSEFRDAKQTYVDGLREVATADCGRWTTVLFNDVTDAVRADSWDDPTEVVGGDGVRGGVEVAGVRDVV
jgi:hypothetical protein